MKKKLKPRPRPYRWLAVAGLLFMASCMLPRQVEAQAVVTGLVQDGTITPEIGQLLISALNPMTWLDDALVIAGGSLATFFGVNIHRNRQRVKRGEPVKTTPTT